jgi:replication factor C subunit 1
LVFVTSLLLIIAFFACRNEVINVVAKTADSLSLGDMVDRRIRSQMAWSLLPTQAMFSSVLPGEYMAGSFTSQINFPGWLGKNSRLTKRKRLAQEIHDHTRLRTSGSRLSIRLDYAPFLLAAIVNPLKQKGMDGVADSLAVIKEYRLLREDIDALIELCSWPKKKSPWDEVESKVKAALTRAYNKEVQPYSYSVVSVGAKKKRAIEAADEEGGDGYGLEGEEDTAYKSDDENDEEEEDKLEANAFIKVKKKPAAAVAKAETSKASGSKSKASGAAKGSKAKK